MKYRRIQAHNRTDDIEVMGERIVFMICTVSNRVCKPDLLKREIIVGAYNQVKDKAIIPKGIIRRNLNFWKSGSAKMPIRKTEK